jgi:hypothetical protein
MSRRNLQFPAAQEGTHRVPEERIRLIVVIDRL